ncbi:hypothetical protein JCM11491_004907 [Sporobolomyces phaffii]
MSPTLAPTVDPSPVPSPLKPPPSSSLASCASTAAATTTTTTPSYHAEIASMVFVLTGTRPASDSRVVDFIQDVVRQHLVKLVVAAKLQALRTSRARTTTILPGPAKSVPPASGAAAPSAAPVHVQLEDLLFVVRRDRSKLERLKLYLGWKDVRKKTRAEPTTTSASASSSAGGGGGGADDDEIDGIEEPDKKDLKVGKSRITLPWELQEPWTDYLVSTVSHSSSSASRGATPSATGGGGGARDDEDDDVVLGGGGGDAAPLAREVLSVEERRAYQVNRDILREANALTEKMTKDEYEQYSTARQASFVYRKGKKFRDFLLVDSATNLSDELVDVLGFLAYELVRTLCRAGAHQAHLRLAHAQQQLERDRRDDEEEDRRREGTDVRTTQKRKLVDGDRDAGSPRKQRKEGDNNNDDDDDLVEAAKLDPDSKDFPSVLRPVPGIKEKKGRRLEPIVSLFSAPVDYNDHATDDECLTNAVGGSGPHRGQSGGSIVPGRERDVAIGAAGPVVAKGAIEMRDLLDGFWNEPTLATLGSLAGAGDKSAMGKGLRGWRGGTGALRGGASLIPRTPFLEPDSLFRSPGPRSRSQSSSPSLPSDHHAPTCGGLGLFLPSPSHRSSTPELRPSPRPLTVAQPPPYLLGDEDDWEHFPPSPSIPTKQSRDA